MSREAMNRVGAFIRGENMDDIRAGKFDEPVKHPSHYNHGAMECWDEMEIVFGTEATFHFAICNAWKYRNRAPYKGKLEQDMQKSDEYMLKAKELKEKMENGKT